jgi:hypothetical protein
LIFNFQFFGQARSSAKSYPLVVALVEKRSGGGADGGWRRDRLWPFGRCPTPLLLLLLLLLLLPALFTPL